MGELLTIDDLAPLLKLSKRSVYSLTRAKARARQKYPLPMIRINGNVRFIRADVEAWIQKLKEEHAA